MTGRLGMFTSTLNPVHRVEHNHFRTFVAAWQSTMKLHDTMAENRIRFAQRLNEMSEDLATLAKEVDKNRKQVMLHSIHYTRL
jgi:hypothetical protein